MSESKKLDLLLIHSPKFNNFYNPFGYFVMNNVIAWGMFSIADWASQNGYGTEILHLGAETLVSRRFSLGDYIEKRRPRLIGMSCHWHYQLYDVCELARKIKLRFPDISIVVGGYTATYFSDDILASQTGIDFIVRGEAEEPVLKLLEAVEGRSDIGEVPNLSYRQGEVVRHNAITFSADKRFLEGLTFCRLDLLKNYKIYQRYLSYPVWLRSYPRFLNYSILTSGRMEGYMVPVGRGCPVNCVYCGGGREWAASHFGRTKTVLRSPERVMSDILRARSFGAESLYFPFDPYPRSDYYPRLFQRIRKAGLRFYATFESFGLPNSAFVSEFAMTFGRDRRNQILLSPETGSEALRSSHKGYSYSNRDLFDTLDRIEREGVGFQICYSLGLPGESEDTLRETLNLWNTIAGRYRNCVIQTATLIDFDPGSPAEQSKEVPRYTFDSLYRMHRDSHKRSYTGWTYLPQRHVCREMIGARDPGSGYRSLRRTKCRHFCTYMDRFHIRYPFNRILCVALGVLFRIVRRPVKELPF
ncbi:cobalamin-dependent protein [Thermodesulfobacteriota bacterium]